MRAYEIDEDTYHFWLPYCSWYEITTGRYHPFIDLRGDLEQRFGTPLISLSTLAKLHCVYNKQAKQMMAPYADVAIRVATGAMFTKAMLDLRCEEHTEDEYDLIAHAFDLALSYLSRNYLVEQLAWRMQYPNAVESARSALWITHYVLALQANGTYN